MVIRLRTFWWFAVEVVLLARAPHIGSAGAQGVLATVSLGAPRTIVSGESTEMDLRRQPIVAISGSGRVAMTDGATFVGVVDGGGRLQRFGRAGNGPGEMQQVTGIGWLGDTLYIIDGRLRRISWIHAGQLHRTAPYIGGRRGSQPLDLPMALSSHGALVPGVGDGRADALYKPRRWALFLASSDGAQVRDSLFEVVDPTGALTVARGGGMVVLRQPYSMRTLVAWSGNGAWFARADRGSADHVSLGGVSARLALRDARGRVVYDLPIPTSARSLPSAEVAALVDSAVAALNRNPRLPPISAAEYRRALAVPSRVPAVMQMIVVNDGTVLVRP
jgi:hypothetical protein